MSEQSPTSEQLLLLKGLTDFEENAIAITQKARHRIAILSYDLDFPVYDREEFSDALSAAVRANPHVHAQILVKDIKPLVERGHYLARLAQRLPSKIEIRKLGAEPTDKDMAFLIADKNLLLFKNDDRDYSGFANYDAGPEVQHLNETFAQLWQQSSADPDLRRLS